MVIELRYSLVTKYFALKMCLNFMAPKITVVFLLGLALTSIGKEWRKHKNVGK